MQARAAHAAPSRGRGVLRASEDGRPQDDIRTPSRRTRRVAGRGDGASLARAFLTLHSGESEQFVTKLEK